MKTQNKKGFTLIELLIVIGILAVLSTATVLMLNPAQMLAESRDTQRMNDLNTLSTAISLMQATSACPSLGGMVQNPVTNFNCSAQVADATFACGTNFGSSSPALTTALGVGALRFFTAGATVTARNGVRTTVGNGWMAADLAVISGGSPVSVLPVDPINDIVFVGGAAATGLNYQYACDTANGRFELDANLESTKYTTGATANNKEANTSDGGNNNDAYETGSILSL